MFGFVFSYNLFIKILFILSNKYRSQFTNCRLISSLLNILEKNVNFCLSCHDIHSDWMCHCTCNMWAVCRQVAKSGDRSGMYYILVFHTVKISSIITVVLKR